VTTGFYSQSDASYFLALSWFAKLMDGPSQGLRMTIMEECVNGHVRMLRMPLFRAAFTGYEVVIRQMFVNGFDLEAGDSFGESV
jgi:hypothetical protein